MSDAAALLFVLIASPLAAAVGYFLLGRPSEIFGLAAHFSRWSLRVTGFDPSVMKWLAIPLQRRLFGDPATFLDRACENPSQFRIVIVLLRLQGIFLIVLSVFAAAIGAISFVSD